MVSNGHSGKYKRSRAEQPGLGSLTAPLSTRKLYNNAAPFGPVDASTALCSSPIPLCPGLSQLPLLKIPRVSAADKINGRDNVALDVLGRSDRRKITPRTKTDLNELVDELETISEQFYCVQAGEFIRNEVNFSAPVVDGNRNPLAAVVISLLYPPYSTPLGTSS